MVCSRLHPIETLGWASHGRFDPVPRFRQPRGIRPLVRAPHPRQVRRHPAEKALRLRRGPEAASRQGFEHVGCTGTAPLVLCGGGGGGSGLGNRGVPAGLAEGGVTPGGLSRTTWPGGASLHQL